MSGELRAGQTTLHLAPEPVWESQKGDERYLPEAYEADGFIHCTDGEANLLEVANGYYRADSRRFVVLTIATDRLTSPVRYEDPERIYPHVYGPLNLDAVVAVRDTVRQGDGTFTGIKS